MKNNTFRSCSKSRIKSFFHWLRETYRERERGMERERGVREREKEREREG